MTEYRVETMKSHTLAELTRVEAMKISLPEKVPFNAGFRKTVDMFPRTNGLRRMGRKVDKFRCIRLDLFPRTSGGSDIKMDVSSHVETVALLSKLY